ncbi:MAG: leucyl aminopeptidase family protein [Burkholderiales bacterium]
MRLNQQAAEISAKDFAAASHVLVLIPKSKTLPNGLPGIAQLKKSLARKNIKPDELAITPVFGETGQGGIAGWAMVDESTSVFEQHTLLRKALQILLDEKPQSISICVNGNAEQRMRAAENALYVCLANAAPTPTRKNKNGGNLLNTINIFGYESADNFALSVARAEGNALARELTHTPPNELTPKIYRAKIKVLAKQHGWKMIEHDMKALRKMGAGAFVAVAQGSSEDDAAIVHLKYSAKNAKQKISLVGKGICFDTGGHNLKSARYMHGMHEDMNGSAVALGILLAATRLKLPLQIDCWLAIAQNHIGPNAYKQNDVVTALNGTSIEIMHTDAEGRMVLADTLTLAAREKPAYILDFATLTGSMIVALGNRYSGVFGNRDDLVATAIAAGRMSGERLNSFPLDADYDPALDSKIADTKQCILEGEADAILAARFLNKFNLDVPWLHVDLSAERCEGGLGAISDAVTGFGVGFGLCLLRR